MRNFVNRLFLLSLRNFHRSCHQTPILLALAATATGAAVYSANDSEDNGQTRVLVSISEELRQNFSSAWGTMQDVFGIQHLYSTSGHGVTLSRIDSGSVESFNLSKEGSGRVGENGKCGSGCLGRDSIVNAAAMVGPAVVNVSVTQDRYGELYRKSVASGTIIDPDGTILTCAHAVVDFHSKRSFGNGKIDVTLQDGRTFQGTVVNADFHSDIAIVKIKSKTPLPTAKLGSSCKLRPGDWVVAMGCPLSLQNTVTAGIVSCVDRKSSDLGLGGMQREYLQTDCAINMGNSGGPLVNLDGEIVGVNHMKISGSDGLSFAVPIDSVSKIIMHFNKNGRVVRPWLGLKMLDLNEMIIAQLKERDSAFPDVRKGVLVPMVTPGSPGDRAGFCPGDVVIEFGGKPVESIKEIIDIMGDDVKKSFKVVLKRANGKLITLTVVPEEANPDM